MAIIPPDPGKAISAAKLSEYDETAQGMRCGTEVRWLRVDTAAEAWETSGTRDRVLSRETFDLLKAGEVSTERKELGLFRSPATGPLYALVDDGFTAKAVPSSGQ